jgi:hypothetical protein
MSQKSITRKLRKQGMKTERECSKLQSLLNDNFPRSTFKWDKENDEIILFKQKRQRIVIHDDNGDNEPEIKPKRDVLFKREDEDSDDSDDDKDQNNNNIVVDNTNNNNNNNIIESDNDDDNDENLAEFLLHFSQQLNDVPVTWGEEPQSPWSQHQEVVEQPVPAQQNVTIGNIVEPIQIPNLYTTQGVGLFLLFCHLYCFYSKLQSRRPAFDPLVVRTRVVVDRDVAVHNIPRAGS